MNLLRFVLFRLFLSLCRWLPLACLHVVGRLWGHLLFRVPNRARNTTFRNLQACWSDRASADIDRLARESLQNTACTALEMGKAWLPPLSRTVALVTETEGVEPFLDATRSGKGVILLAPHLGNWEIFGLFLCQNLASTWLYQPPKLSALDHLLRNARSRGGIKMAAAGTGGVAASLRALSAGEVVGILPDQVPAAGSGDHAPLFGQPAYTMTLVGKLIQRTGALAFCGFAKRLPGSRGFRVIVRKADPLVYSADPGESLRGLNRSVEQCVQLAPAQYQWEYKRFRRQPGGGRFY